MIKTGKHSYLTLLCECHEITDNNIHQVIIGDVALMHDDAP